MQNLALKNPDQIDLFSSGRSVKESVALLKKKTDLENLVQKFQPLVSKLVGTYGKYLSGTMNDDIRSEANIALIEAINSFDPKKANYLRIEGWIKFNVTSHVRKFIYANSKVVKGPQSNNAIKMFWLLGSKVANRIPTKLEMKALAKDYMVDLKDIENAINHLKSDMTDELCDTKSTEFDFNDAEADIIRVSKTMGKYESEVAEKLIDNPELTNEQLGESFGKTAEWARLKRKNLKEHFYAN